MLLGILVTALAVLSPCSTSAPAADASATLRSRAEADRVMRMSYGAFVAWTGGAAAASSGLDLSSDGCSPPTPAGVVDIFDAPCRLHDFGYRNYGGPNGLGRDEGSRGFVDDRFHEEMDRLCADTHRGFAEQGNRQVCEYQSDLLYGQVRAHGRGAFYGG